MVTSTLNFRIKYSSRSPFVVILLWRNLARVSLPRSSSAFIAAPFHLRASATIVSIGGACCACHSAYSRSAWAIRGSVAIPAPMSWFIVLHVIPLAFWNKYPSLFCFSFSVYSLVMVVCSDPSSPCCRSELQRVSPRRSYCTIWDISWARSSIVAPLRVIILRSPGNAHPFLPRNSDDFPYSNVMFIGARKSFISADTFSLVTNGAEYVLD